MLETPPTRDHVVLGNWRAAGDSHTSAEQLVALGRQKGAEIGADYLFVKKQDSITRHSLGPTGPFGMRMQSGMSVSSVATLRAELGFFAKGTLGLVYENRGPRSTKRVVKGFTAGSKASAAGILVGDEILEIDGLWANDRRDLAKFMLGNSPGQIVTVVLRRNEQREELKVPLVENR